MELKELEKRIEAELEEISWASSMAAVTSHGHSEKGKEAAKLHRRALRNLCDAYAKTYDITVRPTLRSIPPVQMPEEATRDGETPEE